ncbi:MAG: M28 family peptidase [Chitinophagales bacterium]|nr:M28 family peptidase [Chitinophagales bacterium]MDW8393273.1 M28 family peptidase [Chitinophagales bacterium]
MNFFYTKTCLHGSLTALFMLLLLAGCGKKKSTVVETQEQKPVATALQSSAPDFNADSAYAYIAAQVAFGPRIPGTAAHENCARWMENQLRRWADTVYVQRTTVEIYNGSRVPCINLIASFNRTVSKRLLLFAHWDTRPWSDRDPQFPRKPFDGADDGGSGVGVWLECARLFAKQPPAVGIDIAFFDVEDYGPPAWETESPHNEEGYCLGSRAWIDRPHVPNYRGYYGILLDMVGARNATFLQEGVSLEFAPSIVEKVWSTAAALGYGNYFLNVRVPGIVDDHTYINRFNFTPSIDIIHLSRETETGFGPHWHTQNDNMSIIDRNTLKAVGQTVLQVIYAEPAEVL